MTTKTIGYGLRTVRPEHRMTVFIACEGYKSENQYFESIDSLRNELRISPSVNIVVLHRFEDESGLSDPLRVAKLAVDYLRWVRDGVLSVHLFAGMVAAQTDAGKDFAEVRRRIETAVEAAGLSESGHISDLEEAKSVAYRELEYAGYAYKEFPIESHEFREGDVMCIVVDRDKSKSRKEARYREFLEYCRENGLEAYVTNPKFELWALLHFKGSDESLDEIRCSSNPSRIIDRELLKLWIPKKQRDYGVLAPMLDVAMSASSTLPCNTDELERQIGTNIPDLIRKLRGQSEADR